MSRFQSNKGIILLLQLLLLVFSQSAFTNNGAFAYAYPLDGITFDGNLDDWPGGLIKYPMQFIGVGVSASSTTDLPPTSELVITRNQKRFLLPLK